MENAEKPTSGWVRVAMPVQCIPHAIMQLYPTGFMIVGVEGKRIPDVQDAEMALIPDGDLLRQRVKNTRSAALMQGALFLFTLAAMITFLLGNFGFGAGINAAGSVVLGTFAFRSWDDWRRLRVQVRGIEKLEAALATCPD